jgi:L-methionine (R)-S-oxide reductase
MPGKARVDAISEEEWMDAEAKRNRYRDTLQQLSGVLPGARDAVAVMASTTSLLRDAVPAASWVGFYRVVAPGLLRVGPYQGPLGCLEIPFSQGVCGAAASQEATQLVPDVQAFPGHIACDAQARSEVVVPVRDRHGMVVAVLDVDSHELAAFDAIDCEGLEAVARQLAPFL